MSRTATIRTVESSTAQAPRFYFAYGSNLWLAQMSKRCPDNCLLGLGTLNKYRWVISYRGYANVLAERKGKDLVYGVVYELSEEDEKKLDVYEGVAQGSYEKHYLDVNLEGTGMIKCLVYVDPRRDEGKPWKEYIVRINNGLRDVSLPEDWVKKYIRPFIPESLA